MLIGRDHELQALHAALAAAESGVSSVLVLSGEPGIGKSALLADAREAATGSVLSTVGMEGESGIAYVNLADVFRHHLSDLDAIADRQGAALASIFAVGPSSPADRFTVSVATLSLLAAIANRGPVLVTVDDAHWLDPASFDALLFAANRLEVEGVVLVFGVRPGTAAADRLGRFPTLALAGLDAASARALVTSSGLPPLSEVSAARLVEESGGNPLALITLPSTMTAEDLSLWALGDEPLPIGSVLQSAFEGSIHELPESTRRALLLLAVTGSDAPQHLRPTLEAEGLSLDDLDPAEDAGLVGYEHGRLDFRHPLIRASVYQGASSRQRRRAHQRAAALLAHAGPSMLERRGWHLVAGGAAPDDALADAFAAAADHELQSANFTVAGKLYERSSQLTPGRKGAMRRLLQAAHALRLAGAIDECRTLLQDARGLDKDPELVSAVGHALHRLEVWRGAMLTGRDGLLQIGRRLAVDHPGPAADILSDAALASIVIGDLPTATAASTQAMSLVADGQQAAPLQVATIAAMVMALTGDPAARAVLEQRADEIDAVDALGVDFFYQLILAVSIGYQALEEIDRAADLLERAVEGARDRSAVGLLPFRLSSLSRIEFWRGRWTRSRALVHEGLRLAADTGWVGERPSSLAALARLEAVTGQPEEARAHAAEAIAASTAAGATTYRCLGLSALGLLELTQGRPAAAIEAYQEIADFADEVGFADSPVLWWSSDLIECLVLEGRQDAAERELARLEKLASSVAQPTTVAVAARCRALVHPDDFEQQMRLALTLHERAAMPFETARTRLLLGEYLRRRGQQRDARAELSAALAVFDRLGAVDWASRARNELEAAGVRVRGPETGLTELSPQELQVALAVARGLSNREVAGQLFLSTKTIEFHLRNVFQKLGINRRTQLAALVARQESLPSHDESSPVTPRSPSSPPRGPGGRRPQGTRVST